MRVRVRYEGGNIVVTFDAGDGAVVFAPANAESTADVNAAYELGGAWMDYYRRREDESDPAFLSFEDEVADWLETVCGRDAVKVEPDSDAPPEGTVF